MKRIVRVLVLIVLLLTTSNIALASVPSPDPNRPALPPNQPILRAPYNDPAVKMVCGDGCGNHTDSSTTIKTYYARDYEKRVGTSYPTTFDVIAVADGKGWGIGTSNGKLTNILPQPGCPVDANLTNDTPNKIYDGNRVYIDHGNGWYSFYFHLDQVYITDGQDVKAGDVIGTAGCTGAQTIHLHYDLRWRNTAVNPNIWWDYAPSFSPPPPPDQKAVDLAFAIDTTGSMWDDIAAVKNAANDIVDYIFEAAPDSRIALTDFRDFPSRTGASYDYPYKDELAFSDNKEDVKRAINSLNLGYGGDGPETRNCALMHVFNADHCAGKGFNTTIGTWRPIQNKFVVYLTDASALNPEPFTNFTNDTVTNAAKAGGFEVMGGDEDPTGYPDVPLTPYGIAVYPVVVGGDPTAIAEANELAAATGGKVFTAANASEVAGAIIEAIQTIVEGGPVLTVPSEITGQYSDLISFTVTATDPDYTGDTLTFSATDLPNDLILTDNGDGTATISGIVNVAPGAYTAQITVTDPGGLSDTKPVNIIVTQEDARTTYTGPLMVSTGCATCSTATVPLRATIQDITAVLGDPAYDPDTGNITNATVSFVDRNNGDAVLCSTNVILLDQSDQTTGTAFCDWTADLGNSPGADYVVGVVVNGYYTRNSSDEDTVVVASKPMSNFITGGGYFINQNSGGTYFGDPELKTNFGLTIKFNKKLTNLQGHVTIIVRQGGHVYQIKSNALSSLVSVPYDPAKPRTGTAELIGKANVTDVTDPLNPIMLTGNATLNIVMKDNGEPGNADLISVSLWSNDGDLLFSSNWNGVQTTQQLLDGGNLNVK